MNKPDDQHRLSGGVWFLIVLGFMAPPLWLLALYVHQRNVKRAGEDKEMPPWPEHSEEDTDTRPPWPEHSEKGKG